MNFVKRQGSRKILLLVLAAALCIGFALSPYASMWASAEIENEEIVQPVDEPAPQDPDIGDEDPDLEDGDETDLGGKNGDDENENPRNGEDDDKEDGDVVDTEEGDEEEEEEEPLFQRTNNMLAVSAIDVRALALLADKTVTVSNNAAMQAEVNAAGANTSLTLVVSGDFEMTDTILINKNLTIYIVSASGGNNTLLMAKSYERHFTVAAGTVNLYFDGITLAGYKDWPNGDVTRGGGFQIDAGSTAYIYGAITYSTGIGSQASGYATGGGAIYNAGYLTVANSRLEKSDNFSPGGGVYVAAGGHLVIAGTKNEPVVISKAGASDSGGGIYVAEGASMEANYLHITADMPNPSGSDMESGGKAMGGAVYGGGIYWVVDKSAPGTQSLTNSIIEDSYSAYTSGGIHLIINNGATLHEFSNNIINNNLGTISGGGMTLVNNGTIAPGSFSDNRFTNNYGANGAALHILGSADVPLHNTIIENNMGSITHTTVTGNLERYVIYSSAGILSNTTGTVTLTGSSTSIAFNKVNSTAVNMPGGGHGAGIYVQAGTVELADGQIAENTALANGGGVYVAAGAAFRQTGGAIRQNHAAFGGGVYVAEGATAWLQGGSVEANTTAGSGGGLAVYNVGTLHIEGTATIKDHNGTEKNGTVMLGPNSKGYMTGGTITNNTLNYTVQEQTGRGAGIYMHTGSSFTMSGGTISHNTASRGGGIFVQDQATATITGGNILQNRATLFGGGIYLLNSNTLKLDGTNNLLIQGNTAGTEGGAICSYGLGGNNTINIAQTSGSLSIDSNHAENGDGGAIHVRIGDDNALTVTGGSFTNNTASGRGGAIYLFDDNIVARISGGNIGEKDKGNISGGDGGGIYNSAAHLYITGTASVSGNKAGANGGGVSGNYGENIFEGTDADTGPVFAYNEAAGDGGGIHIFNGTLAMEYVTVQHNTARDGGGLYVAVGDNTDGLLSLGDMEEIEAIDNNVFSNNAATRDGGGLYVSIRTNGVSDSISGNTVEDNTAGRNGGGVYAMYLGEGKRISDNTVKGNVADGNGGGLYVVGTMKRYFAITSDKVIENTAKGNGGGVFVSGTILRVYNTSQISGEAEISGNFAANGGGIYASGYAKVVVEQGKIEGNTATTGNGGGIYSNAILVDDDSQLSDDPVTGTIGYKGILVSVDVASVSNNKAELGNGGGIYIGEEGGLKLRGSTIDGNTAKSGGGVYIATYGLLDIHTNTGDDSGTIRTSISGNNATAGDGGGLSVANGVLNLEYADIKNNMATGNGGGLYLVLQKDPTGTGEFQKMVYNVFEENTALNGGGMHVTVMLGAVSKVIGDNQLLNNTAQNDGGGAWLEISGTGKSVYQNLIQGNNATRGGGIFVTGTPAPGGNNMSFTNDEILDNHATENGGGIYVYNSTLVLFDAEAVNAAMDGAYTNSEGKNVEGHALISGNIAATDKDSPENSSTGNGGGIYLHGSNLYVQKGYITGNTAALNGGGIAADSTSLITMDYNNNAGLGVQPAFELDIIGNAAAQGDGGGMHIVPSSTRVYALKNLTVQSNTAKNGDGGGIFVAKNLLQYLEIGGSNLFGTPNPGTAGQQAFYNVARDTSYVDELYPNTTDSTFITLHGNNLSGMSGHSPSEGEEWARVSPSSPDRLYYNNFDIAFRRVNPDKITVNYYANGGRFANDRTHVFGTGDPSDKVNAPTDKVHDEANFIGWYRGSYTAEHILDNLTTLWANKDLDTNGGALGYTIIGTETEDQDFYAAWLFAPKVDLAYEIDTVVTVRGLEKASSVTLYINDVEVTGVTPTSTVVDGVRVWTFDLTGSGLTLNRGDKLEAIQTIAVTDADGVSTYPVTSPRGDNTVLPVYYVYYDLNVGDEEDDTEKARLEAQWLPEDTAPYKSSAVNPLSYTVQPPKNANAGRANHKFLGWSLTPSGGTLLGATGTIYGADVTLYAQWEPLLSLTYHANTGDLTLDATFESPTRLLPDNVTGQERGTGVDIGNWSIANPDSLRPGPGPGPDDVAYRFLHWTTDIDGRDPTHYLYQGSRTDGYNSTITLNSSRDLYAQWQPMWRVRYNWNYDGERDNDTINDPSYYALGDDFTVTGQEPTRPGHTFIGWNYYPAAREGYWYTATDEYTKNEEGTTTLYAHWTPNIAIDYDGNGNDGGTEPDGKPEWPAGFEYTVKDENTLTRDGYVFMGWALNPEGTGTVYGPGERYTNTYTPYEDTTFYAIWKLDTLPDIFKTSGEASLKLGQDFTYTISATNHGPVAVDAVVTDELPDYLTYRGADANNTGTGSSLRFEGPIDPGETWEIEVYVTLTYTYTGTMVRNTAEVVFNGDPDLVETDTDETPVITGPEIDKDSGLQTVLPGESFTYTLTVHNTASMAVNAVVTDTLPEGLTYKASNEENLGDSTALRFEKPMDAGETWVIEIDVTLAKGYDKATVVNTATVVLNSDADLTDSDDDTTLITVPGGPTPGIDPTGDGGTQTGDAAQLTLWVSAALAALLCMGAAVLVKIRKRQQHRKRYAWYYHREK